MSIVCFVLSYLGAFILGVIACFTFILVLAIKHEGKKTNRSNKVSYSMYYNDSPTKDHCDDVLFDTRENAEKILNQMQDEISSFGMITKSGFFKMVHCTYGYTDTKYGWKDLSDAKVVQAREGYKICLPKPIKIEQ